MEGSLVAYKVFTNGSTLQASELNENLMQQATAVFSNAAARTAAITSPVEGQLTYLEDTDRYAMWTGSAWVSPFGMTFLNKTSFTSQTSVTVDNIFTSEFDHYKILVSVVGTTNAQLDIQLRAAGSNLDSADYQRQIGRFSNTSYVGERSSNGTAFIVGSTRNGTRTFSDISMSDPFRTASTQCISQGIDPADGITGRHDFGRFTPTTSATGFRLISSSMTGDIQVFGFRSA
jgi:hypothetical protein